MNGNLFWEKKKKKKPWFMPNRIFINMGNSTQFVSITQSSVKPDFKVAILPNYYWV